MTVTTATATTCKACGEAEHGPTFWDVETSSFLCEKHLTCDGCGKVQPPHDPPLWDHNRGSFCCFDCSPQ